MLQRASRWKPFEINRRLTNRLINVQALGYRSLTRIRLALLEVGVDVNDGPS